MSENNSETKSNIDNPIHLPNDEDEIMSLEPDTVPFPNIANKKAKELNEKMEMLHEIHAKKLHRKYNQNTDDNNVKKEDDIEEIDSDDIRYKMACNKAVNALRHIEASALKPGYENYKSIITSLEQFKLVLILLITVILVLAIPDWCEFKSNVSDDCRTSFNPAEKIIFIRSELPLIFRNAEKKSSIIILSTIVLLINLIKISLCRSDLREKTAFLLCFVVIIVQYAVYLVNTFDIYEINLFDVLTVFTIVFGVPQLQEILFKFINVLYNAKEIIIFLVLFIISFTVSCQIMFFGVENFTDAGDGNYFPSYDFTDFNRSLYSTSIASILGDSLVDVCAFMSYHFKFGILFFIPMNLLSLLFIKNFMMGMLYGYYTNLFDNDVNYIEENYPTLGESIKKEIAYERLDSKNLRSLIEINFLKGNLDYNIYKIDKFYKDIDVLKYYNDPYEKNPDNLKSRLLSVTSTFRYNLIMGIVDIMKLFFIVLVVEIENFTVIWYQLIAFLLSFTVSIDSSAKLFIFGFKGTLTDYMYLYDLLGTCLSFTSLVICSIIYDSEARSDFLMNNEFYLKAFCLLNVFNSFRALGLLTYNKQIRTVVEVVVKSFVFITDILSMICIIVFLYASIGMILFGGIYAERESDDPFEKYDPYNAQFTCNFNDFYSAVLTLLNVMFVGWVGVAAGNQNADEEYGFTHYIFYISFYVFTNMSFLNIIFGFLIDNCQLYLKKSIDEKVDSAGARADELSEMAESRMDSLANRMVNEYKDELTR